jgi:hypothetical protein
LAYRLAEKSYRRGVQQGAAFMADCIGNGGDPRDFDSAVYAWRVKGRAENFRRPEHPPGSLFAHRGGHGDTLK